MSGWSQSIVFDSELLEKLDFKTENVQKTPKNFKDPFPRSKTSGFLISDQNQDTINTSLEVIEESPTRECNNRTMAHQSIRERLRNATIARKQVLKRNKSDSFVAAAKNVEQKPPPPSLIENESISKYFQSQFDVPECVADHENTVEPKEENMVNLSKLMMDSFTLNLQGSENPQPVLSRTNYDDLFKDSFKIEIDVPRDSDKSLPFEFSEKLMDKAISDDTLITETEKQELINDIDSMSFIQQPVLDLENSLFVEREMENEKDFLKSVLISQEIEDEVFKAPEILSIKQVSSQLSKSLVVDCTKNLLLISNWNLPTAVVNEYRKKNVVEMFEWQCDCLKNPKVLFENTNLVYSAPTSAGKTLVSEILMIKNIIERKKQALFILPFISVVREKMFYLQDLLQSSGLRVEGFFGGYQPAGSFESINLAVCTIEKANSIVNKLLEQSKLMDLGIIVIDEIHLISDNSRGYILELLLTKVLYMCKKFGYQVQIITMSATIPNLNLLSDWLEAEFFFTDFRPIELKEMIKVNDVIYDNEMKEIRKISNKYAAFFNDDTDQIGQLAMETLIDNTQLLIFCPTKAWCESLAQNLANGLKKIIDRKLKFSENILDKQKILDLMVQFKNLPSGVDAVLDKTLVLGCAYHHAGLTTDERDLIEFGFKDGSLRILVATSTLSSGVNLPARRVIIRSPMFAGKIMSNLTYKQMIGRAGRKGKDILGESILICNDANLRCGKELIAAKLDPITSCLNAENSANMKRALLEIIASGVASSKKDLEDFVNLTLFYKQNKEKFLYFDENDDDVKALLKSKKKWRRKENKDETEIEMDTIKGSMNFLLDYEFIRFQLDEDTDELKFVPTRLGLACLSSSMPPNDGFLLFSELQRSRQNFVLESELHAIYLVTPFSVCYQLQQVDWLFFFDLWDKLPPPMKRVGEMVGVKDGFFIRAMKNTNKLDYKALQIHKRFYTALALQELVNERPISSVAAKYKCSKGMLQSLQQMSATFAGIVTSFCKSLNWNLMALILGQFRERLFFGIHPDLIDLMKLPNMNCHRARSLFKKGIEKVVDLANSKTVTIENILLNSIDFDCEIQRDNENEGEAQKRIKRRNFFITGKSSGLTVVEAAKILIEDARKFVEFEMGAKNVNWSNTGENEQIVTDIVQPNDDLMTNSLKKRKATTPLLATSQVFQKKQQKTDISTPKNSRRSKGDLEMSATYRERLRSSRNSSLNGSLLEISPKINRSIDEITSSQKSFDDYTKRFSHLTSTQIGNSTRTHKTRSTVADSNKENSDNRSLFHHSILIDPETVKSLDISEESSRVKIIDVLAKESIFMSFLAEVAGKNEITLSVGVKKFEKTSQKIGGTLMSRNDLISEDEHQFVFHNHYFVDCLSICYENGIVCYLNLQQAKKSEMITILKRFLVELFQRPDLMINIFDAKEQLKVLIKVIPEIRDFNVKVMDPKIAYWLINPDKDVNMEKMVHDFAPDMKEIFELAKSSLGLNHCSNVAPKIRTAAESLITMQVMQALAEALKAIGKGYVFKVFKDLEMPIQTSLLKMELKGFGVNESHLYELSEKVTRLLKTLEETIYEVNGRKFNLTSSKDVAQVLGIYKNLQIARSKRVSTSKKVLSKLEMPLADLIMQYRKMSAILSNSVQPLLNSIQNNRIFGKSFSLTQTGRISMYDPNLQNVSKDFQLSYTDAKGNIVSHLLSCRRTFAPVERSNFLVTADFCQLELRILTHLSQDASLLKIMQSKDEDIFRKIAAKWHRVQEQNVTESMRNQTKQICYGIIYGMGAKSLAESLNVEEQSAIQLSEEFHKTYPGIKKYTDRIIAEAKKKGFIETITGRRRYFPGFTSENLSEKSQAERQAVNTTIQGSASDLVKNAILRMERNLIKPEYKLNSSDRKSIGLVLHMHDELIYEVPKSKLREVAKVLKFSMENCVKMTVPLLVKVKSGANWGQMVEEKNL